MSDQLKERMQRVRGAKAAITALASAPPHFLYSQSDQRAGQLAVDRYGQVWYIDAITGLMLYPFPGHAWKGFSAGPELRNVVAALALYVRDGQLVNMATVDAVCAKAYGKHWPTVRAELAALAIAAPAEMEQ